MNKDLEKIRTSFDVPEDEAKCIYHAITTIRDIKNKFIDDEDMVMSDCLEMERQSKYVYYPIDIIELRLFLQLNGIPGRRDVFFSFPFARKYGKTYPLLLCIDVSGCECIDCGGMTIIHNNISLKERLKRIYVSPKLQKDRINSISDIIKHEEFAVDIIVDIDVPGINPKIASGFTEYVVNISQIGIKNMTIRAANEQDAVVNAVNKLWYNVKHQHNNVRPYQYKPEHWLRFQDSSFWANMVKPAHNDV